MITLDKVKKVREATDCSVHTAREFLYSCDGDVSKTITTAAAGFATVKSA